MTADRRTSNLAVLSPRHPKKRSTPRLRRLKRRLSGLLVVFAILLALTLGGWL